MKPIQGIGNLFLWAGAVSMVVSLYQATHDNFMGATAFAILANGLTASGAICWIYVAHRLRMSLDYVLTQPYGKEKDENEEKDEHK